MYRPLWVGKMYIVFHIIILPILLRKYIFVIVLLLIQISPMHRKKEGFRQVGGVYSLGTGVSYL
jgi:hypothetical protein